MHMKDHQTVEAFLCHSIYSTKVSLRALKDEALMAGITKISCKRQEGQ